MVCNVQCKWLPASRVQHQATSTWLAVLALSHKPSTLLQPYPMARQLLQETLLYHPQSLSELRSFGRRNSLLRSPRTTLAIKQHATFNSLLHVRTILTCDFTRICLILCMFYLSLFVMHPAGQCSSFALKTPGNGGSKICTNATANYGRCAVSCPSGLVLYNLRNPSYFVCSDSSPVYALETDPTVTYVPDCIRK